ncbi:hypothetical protein PR202_ga08704 [Eleusine coracana subsp. coracana]|uniref:Uncharacterized protein n=1 Tax=Eleusine coracana subsp. coracana TaxID=191504 RepID=A0AAV5C230_ELECO|nr:hypothetical protein PR202_ga08704 [Eleusine coracana subsp. coracana]
MKRDQLPAASWNWKCCLSESPTSPSCVAEPKFLYCRVGDDDNNNRWTEHEYDVGNVMLPPEYAPPTKWVIKDTAAVGGRFYFLEMGKLGVIEFAPEPLLDAAH